MHKYFVVSITSVPKGLRLSKYKQVNEELAVVEDIAQFINEDLETCKRMSWNWINDKKRNPDGRLPVRSLMQNQELTYRGRVTYEHAINQLLDQYDDAVSNNQ